MAGLLLMVVIGFSAVTGDDSLIRALSEYPTAGAVFGIYLSLLLVGDVRRVFK